MIWKSNENR